MSGEDEKTIYTIGDVEIARTPVWTSAMDATVLRGYRYDVVRSGTGRKAADKRSPFPLLCLPSDLGNTREFHDFILKLQSLPNSPARVIALDLRGRGRSDHAPYETYSAIIETDDVISFCDAHSLHHVDLLASGHSAMVALLLGPKRPALIRAMIFNDGGPERDGVGIARMQAMTKDMPQPRDWDDAVAVLRKIRGKQFSALSDENWMEMARATWRDDGGTPVPDHDPVLASVINQVDFDERQPTLWTEMGMLKNRPILMIRGEKSPLMTAQLAERMQGIVCGMKDYVALGQGHVPLLNVDFVTEKILDFLSALDETRANDHNSEHAN